MCSSERKAEFSFCLSCGRDQRLSAYLPFVGDGVLDVPCGASQSQKDPGRIRIRQFAKSPRIFLCSASPCAGCRGRQPLRRDGTPWPLCLKGLFPALASVVGGYVPPQRWDGAGVGTHCSSARFPGPLRARGRLGTADRKGVGRPHEETGGFCVGAAACPRPAANRAVNENRAANSYNATNSPHDSVLPPAGEDVSAADR